MSGSKDDRKEYRYRLGRALQDSFLRQSLENFALAYPESRRQAFAGLDFQELVDDIAARKTAAMSQLEQLYQSFKKNAESVGAVVHLATTAEEANEIIAEIGRSRGVRKIVKSKSMTAEETFLNKHLEKEGFQVTETDLGEWIIQLRGEGPSHMVMPAIHLSRQQVAELFAEVSGEVQDPDDIQALVQVARKHLRRAFLQADMGISGANFAIADSGAIGIITNEGNGRMVTTMPKTHVVLLGLDKLVPDLSTALRLLAVLPRNATGQKITSYVTWISGAVAHGCTGAERKDFHIVFLDNGRLSLARDPVFSEALRCVRCGACANVCPIYRLVGGHNYGHVYIGAIGLVFTLFFHGRDNARVLLGNCLNCQACKEICAAGIDLPRLITEAKRFTLEDQGKPVANRLLATVLGNRKLFHFLLRQASLLQKPLTEAGYLRHLPLFFSREHRFRRLPALASTPLRDSWSRLATPPAEPRLKVALFGGCLVDFVYPEQGRALVRLLAAYDVQLDYPPDQTCCGLPAMMLGEKATARHVARQNIAALNSDAYDYILTICASCGSHLKRQMPLLLSEDRDVAAAARSCAAKVIDFSSFMVRVLEIDREKFPGRKRKVAYHAPCHLCRGLRVVQEPRQLLHKAGLQYVASEDEDMCCGFAGSYSIDFPEISAEILQRKLTHLQASGAEMVVTDCPGCVLQLRGGLQVRNSNMKVRHMVEAVAEELI
ncbi:MAG: LUD domain-containing protein [Deltaproteobacteria bacterium]|nr:LUD domain-containing protein [Deltaproteobacteria bacterium]